MPTKWTIQANGVGPGTNDQDLVGCHIAKVTGANNTLQYAFETPNGTPVSTTSTGTTTSYPTPPFEFPEFTSALSQRSGPTAVSWYITVCTLTGGRTNNQASGTWGNSVYADCPAEGMMGEPPDTWVATAGSGSGEDEEASAASA